MLGIHQPILLFGKFGKIFHESALTDSGKDFFFIAIKRDKESPPLEHERQ